MCIILGGQGVCVFTTWATTCLGAGRTSCSARLRKSSVMTRLAGQHLLARASQTAWWGELLRGPDTHSSPCLPGEQSESQRQCSRKQLFSWTLRQGMISNNRKTHGCSQAVLWKGSPKACKHQGCVTCHRCSCTSQLAESWAPCLSGQLKAANCSK